MTRIVKILPLAVPFFFFVAYLHLKFFYGNYGIMIEQWIGWNELGMLFLDDLSTFIGYGILILSSTYVAFHLKRQVESLKEKKFNLGKHETPSKMAILSFLGHVVVLLVIGFVLITIIFDKARTSFDKGVDSLFAFSILLVTIPLLYRRKEIQGFFDMEISNFSALLFIFSVAFLIHSLSNAMKKTHQFNDSKILTTLIKKGTSEPQIVDSLMYLGKCSDYYFLFNRKEGAPLVIEIDKVENLKMYLTSGGKHPVITTKFEVQH